MPPIAVAVSDVGGHPAGGGGKDTDGQVSDATIVPRN